MTIEADAPIKIAVLGADERSAARMATIFKIVYRGRCEITQEQNATLGIVDLDNEPDVWDKFRRQYPTLPAIVISESPTSIEGTVQVAKPVKLNLLWDAIFSLVTGLPQAEEVASESESAEAPTPEPATPGPEESTISAAASAMDSQIKRSSLGARSALRNDSRDATACFYSPDDYLLGRILSSLADNAGRQCIIHVRCWKDSRLALLPSQGRAYSDLTDSQLTSFLPPC